MHLKRKKNYKFIRDLIFLVLLYLVINFNFKRITFENSNEEFINNLLQSSNYHLVVTRENTNFYEKIIDMVSNIQIKSPVTIIDKVFAYKTENDMYNVQEFSYIQNSVVDNPRVYIYSTHPKEEYKTDGFNVVMASLMLQEKLNSIGVETIVEPRSSSEYIKNNNLSYNNSYLATKEFLTDALEKYGSFDLIIDLHRDSVSKSISTVAKIDGKKYAKIMFVMNKNYTSNYKFAQSINNIISSKYPGISRGIYDKYVDTFNQNLSEKVVLLELGTTYNTYEEVKNSIDALSETIKELLNER